MPPPEITATRTFLAVALGLIALAGINILRNPDGNHFFGRFREDIRVVRTANYVTTLANIAHKQNGGRSFYGRAAKNLVPAFVDSGEIPVKMIDRSVNPPVLRSPWGTEISVLGKERSFSISVPVSPYGCYKLLLALGDAPIISAHANGVPQNLPISSQSEIKGCIVQPVNIVTFTFF